MCHVEKFAEVEDDAEIGFSLDRAKLIEDLFHVTTGVKMVDMRCRHLLTSKLLLNSSNGIVNSRLFIRS